jgi:hypothetical protein
MKSYLSIAFAGWLTMPSLFASTLMQFELGELKVSGSDMVSGTLAFISFGADGIFNSTPSGLALNSTSLISGDDIWLYARDIVGNNVQGNWQEQYAPALVGQKFIALFINSISSSQLNYSTGAFLGGLKIGTGADSTSFQFGTYRTDSVETLGGNIPDPASWVLPANVGSTASFIAYSGTGDYVGQDFIANLNTTGLFTVIPEPSTSSLLLFGSLLALRNHRRKRK